VLHALELAQEDLTFWCGDLSEPELMATPSGLPSIAFHLRHIARSLGRLLTYAEGRQLNERQLQALTGEADSQCLKTEIFSELSAALADSSARILKLGEQADTLNQLRIVGRKNLPTTVAGLLVHISHPKACRTGDNDGKDSRRAAWSSPSTIAQFDNKWS
jgi:hypothetical protein